MTTARTVRVTTEADGDELDAEDAWHLARRHGLRQIAVASFERFRYGDGSSSSRALALQSSLAVVPFLIALTGLASGLEQRQTARVLALTIQRVSPGSGSGDALGEAVTSSEAGNTSAVLALVVGLALSLVSMTVAMGQVERGTNRIYGIRRDRPATAKYARAAALTGVLGVPLGLGFLLLVAGGGFVDAATEVYGWSGPLRTGFLIARWPVGIAMLVLAIAVLLERSPRREQPSLSWLALGAGTAVALTTVATVALAGYVRVSSSFGSTYGPLAGIMALLIWSQLSAVALFYGAAVCAQLEALRSGESAPAYADPGPPD